MARVVELSYYPVKGCAGTSATEAPLTPAGLAHDRSFMVVSEEGVYRTQRRDPRLAVIRPAVTADGEHLTLSAPRTEALHLRVDTSGTGRRWTCSGPPTRASTRATRQPTGSRRCCGPGAGSCAYRRNTTG